MINKRVTNPEKIIVIQGNKLNIGIKIGISILTVITLFTLGYFVYLNKQLNKKITVINTEQSQVNNDIKNEHKYLLDLLSSVLGEEKPWFSQLSKVMIQNNILLTKITDYQETQNGSHVILLLSDQYCSPPVVFRFDTTTSTITKADIDSKRPGCLSAGGEFTTNIIGDSTQFMTRGGDGGCESHTYFSYDVNRNIATLTKEVDFCEGDGKETVTNY